ncbi:hypothetical protein IJ101_02430 [Candidatus Saccharibacteria bacterium]|nr:hypothetical protein [Candidatus Saccharibacteria bacterium]
MRKFAIFSALVLSLVSVPVSAAELTSSQKTSIVDNCSAIKDSLRAVQREDSRIRVYLGRYYESILTKFVTPLNVRLVENSISDTSLIANQEQFVDRRTVFISDYIVYQQALEDLVSTDCKSEPQKFYDKLEITREKRETVNQDVAKMSELTNRQVKLVTKLKDELK